jgi:hypothetical protein
MAKVAGDAAIELPLNDERKPERKQGRHIVIALNHLNKQRAALAEKIAVMTEELESIDASIKALDA